ncbi:AAA family ATPase [Pararhizobium sp. BT-229]|uniref:AAA family ATPase n=1 Tax=Pararhizobium sp. BT-229 TaxID=2986923 RepID=UPI0021F7A8EF|nr:AAA family ATPase [Pararhizobium sp. BT-229]MCV9964372.1 AAA family ATPase [Pararhizobium sp. BT-229]
MAIRNWFRSKGETHVVSGRPAEEDELERIQDTLEDEMLADHLSVVLSRNVTAPPPAEPVDVPAADGAGRSLEMQAQHLFEYHSIFHRRLWGKTSEMPQSDRETVADYLDVLANNMGYRGMYLGSSQLLEIAAHLRESRMQTSLLVEPWMSPFKLRRRDVRDLYIHLCNQAFSLLSSIGEPVGARKDWADEVERAKDSVGRFDLAAFTVIKSAVEAVSLEDNDLQAASLYMNMDYVLACCGDRGAMSRMAGYMEFLVRNDPFVSTRLENAPEEDEVRRIVGRSWMRLAAAVAHSGHDPFSTASEWLPNIWLDLRYIDGDGPNTAERRGLVIPALSPTVDRLAFARRGWRDDRFGEWRGSTISRPVAIDADDPADGERASTIARVMELLKSFGEDVEGKLGGLPGDGGDQGIDEMAARIRGNRGVMEALASLDGTSFDEESRKERSRRIARAFAETMLPQGAVGEGTTAALLSKLVDRKPDQPGKSASSVTVLDHIGPSEATGRAEGRAEETYGRLLHPLPLAVSGIDADAVYDALQSEFPWMKDANQMVAVATARQERQKIKHWRIEPTLLVGPPGVGKTRWIRRVSELTAVPMHTISLSGVAHSKSIIGSERGWASARPSFMAYGFLNTLRANPIFHIDELEKTSTNANEPNIQESFLPILEKETARAYPDMYLLGKLDLRWGSFLFSANDLAKVSPVLLTRVKVVNVRRPSHTEIEKIVDTMIFEACENEEFTEEETQGIRDRIASKATRIFLESADLRDVQRHVDEEVKNSIWKPRGPYLVKS